MAADNVVIFPKSQDNYQEPLRQAMTSDGMPVRVGDAVTITDTAGRRTSGMVQKVGIPGASAVCQVYEVMCTDAICRVVTADQIEALS